MTSFSLIDTYMPYLPVLGELSSADITSNAPTYMVIASLAIGILGGILAIISYISKFAKTAHAPVEQLVKVKEDLFLSRLNEHRSDLENHRARIDSLEKQRLTDKQDFADMLRSEIDKLRDKTSSDIVGVHKEISTLTNETSALRTKLDILTTSVQESHQQLAALTAVVADLSKNMAVMNAQLATVLKPK